MATTTKSFLAGMLLGVLLTVVVFGIHSCARSLSNWGKPVIYDDDPARKAIIADGFTLPASITDPYYFMDGFQDHREFIAFSGPRAVLDEIVTKKTGKKISELAAWKDQIGQGNGMFGPGAVEAKYRTTSYDLTRIKHGLFFSINKGNEGWSMIYDREGGRVYYCWLNQ